jgi:tRNA A-37 threonylcarbamoyl transferase component Bud32
VIGNAVRYQAIFQPVLARLETDIVGRYGPSPLRLVPCESHDRPSSSILLVRVCADDERPLTHLFVKVFKSKVIPNAGPDAMRERVEHDFEATRRTYAAMAGHEELGVVPPVACYPDLLALVTEQVNGEHLIEHLQRHAGWLPTDQTLSELRQTMARVGQWVRVFQQVSPTGAIGSIQELRQYIDIRLERLVRDSRGKFSEADRHQVLHHIDAVGATVAPEELRQVTVHSDLSLGNVLVSNGRIVVLDFAMTRLENWLHDITKVFVRVGLLALKPKFTVRVVRDLQASLLRGFDPSLSTAHPLFRLSVLQHRILHLLALYQQPQSGFQAAFDLLVRSHHWRWLRAELATEIRAEECR